MKKSILSYKISDNTYEALKLLVENSYLIQTIQRPDVLIDEKAWLKEYCTIRFSTSRQAGHSRAIARLACNYFDNVLFITPIRQMWVHIQNILQEQLDGKITKSTASSIETNTGRYDFVLCPMGNYRAYDINSFRSQVVGHECEAIIVDCSNLISPAVEENIYKICAPCMVNHRQKFFIFAE